MGNGGWGVTILVGSVLFVCSIPRSLAFKRGEK